MRYFKNIINPLKIVQAILITEEWFTEDGQILRPRGVYPPFRYDEKDKKVNILLAHPSTPVNITTIGKWYGAVPGDVVYRETKYGPWLVMKKEDFIEQYKPAEDKDVLLRATLDAILLHGNRLSQYIENAGAIPVGEHGVEINLSKSMYDVLQATAINTNKYIEKLIELLPEANIDESVLKWLE